MKNRRGLLAVVMALAMVFAGAVFIADETDAADDVVTLDYYVGGDGASDEYGGFKGEPFKTIDYALTVVKTAEADVVNIHIVGEQEITNKNRSTITGSFQEINFIGVGEGSKMTAVGPGWIGSDNKEYSISFTGLVLDRTPGLEFITDAAWMNPFFAVYQFGKVTFNECVFPHGVCVQQCEAEFNGCMFSNVSRNNEGAQFWEIDYETGLFVYANVDCTVNNSTFNGPRGAVMYKEGGANTSSLTMNGVIFTEDVESTAVIVELGYKVIFEGENTFPQAGVLTLNKIGNWDANGVIVEGSTDMKCVDSNGKPCGAMVDGKIYITLANAIDESEAGDTIYLMYDTEKSISIPDGVTIELNGHSAPNVFEDGQFEEVTEVGEEVSENTVLKVESGIEIDTTIPEVGVELIMQTEDNGSISGVINFGTGENTFIELNEFRGTLKVSKGSIEILGNVDAGTVTLTGEAVLVGDVAIAYGASLVVAASSTLTIPAEMVLTNNGTITNNGKIVVDGSFINKRTFDTQNGETIVAPGVTIDNVTGDITISGESFGMSQDLESDYTVKTSAFLERDLTIPEGVTLTVEGSLNLKGYTLYVAGTLVVEKKGSIETSVRGGTIILDGTGAVTNNGIIGNTTAVTVSGDFGNVQMKGVTGIGFGLTKVKEVGDVLTVSGEVAVKVKESNLLVINGAYVADGFTVKDVMGVDISGAVILKDATMTIGSKAVVYVVADMQNGSTLVVNGTVSGTVEMVNGASVVVNGESDATYTAATGYFQTYKDGKKQTAEDAAGAGVATVGSTSVDTDNLKGITIAVATKSGTYMDDVKTPKTTQMVLVSGIAAVADDKVNTTATLDIDGDAYVATGTELVIPSEVAITTTNIITEGVLKVVDDVNEGATISYKGAKYTVTVTDETTYNVTVTDYYTTFDAAYAAIADADEMKIAISGGYTFEKEYNIAAEQTVTGTGTFKVHKNGNVTIADEGTLELPNLAVEGILTVIYGADCDVTVLTYEVMSKDAETGDITYSGAELAIENAVAGDVIDIVSAVTFEDPVTVAEGVTVNVKDGASITAEKGLTVAGKLVNDGIVTIAADYDLVVTGEVENKGTITLSPADTTAGTDASEMTVTGTVVSEGAIGGTINAATYTDDKDDIVYTTVAVAVASGEENIAVNGEFTENADIVLSEGQTLTINGKVVLGTVRLVAGSTLVVANGAELTADIVAEVGTYETTGALADAIIDVTKISGVAPNGTVFTVFEDESASTYTLRMPDYASGAVVIEAGSVEYTASAPVVFGNVATPNADPVFKTMKVASGAELVVANDIDVEDMDSTKGYLVNEGTIQIVAGVEFIGTTLGGTVFVDVGKTLTLDSMKVTGEIILNTEEGETPANAVIEGIVTIGSAPKTLGASGSIIGEITIGSAKTDYVIVFAGSTFQDTTEDSPVISTAYTVNGTEFATIYAVNDEISVGVINKSVAGLKDLDVKDVIATGEDTSANDWERDYTNDITWYSGSSKATTVGQYASVSSTISYKNVSFTVSVGPGLMVYLDDIQNTTGSASLAIGTHTVTVYVDKGYEGTPVITFNGTTVTDGKLVLTSDMLGKENKLVVTGATPAPETPVVIQPSEAEDDGLALTDILLIVLVVLIVIMAVIVALRMMRS